MLNVWTLTTPIHVYVRMDGLVKIVQKVIKSITKTSYIHVLLIVLLVISMMEPFDWNLVIK